MTRLVFVDVDDTLLTPPYEAVRRVATFFGKKFPGEEAFRNRPDVDYYKAFPKLFKSSAEMWAIALISLPFGHFRSQSAMPFDIERISELLTDHRLYLISKNPPSFTRWRVQRLRQLFSARLGDRYIACGPILKKGPSKLSIITRIASDRGVELRDCLLVDDSAANLTEVAAAGVKCALVKSSWNIGDTESLKEISSDLQVIDSLSIPEVIATHLSKSIEADLLPHFIVPPLTAKNIVRLAWVFLKRWWLYSEPLPKAEQIIPIARNPITSFLFRNPHASIYKRIQRLTEDSSTLSGVRILPLCNDPRPILLPINLRSQLKNLEAEQRVRFFRTVCRDLLRSHGHRFVRDAMFYFTELNRADEKKRILSAERVAQAKETYIKTNKASQKTADALATQYTEEILTSRSYVSCLFGEWITDKTLGRIFKNIHLKTHPMVRELEDDHFLFYASTHRSILDSPVLWSILSHKGQSFPFAVGADKMRKVWFGKLGLRGGTFFIRRKFIDEIYVAVMAEHVSSMQKPGSVIEVFLEGQRSRSGLTLPPKKGIASIVWDNMGPLSKVAIVPVSFTYNKLPESEKLIHESFNERQKLGIASLREVSDIKIRLARRKSFYDGVRSAWRRLRSPLLSECYVHFAEPIVLDKSADKANLQDHLNEAMLRINSATAVLPSSILCLFLLGVDEKHTTFDLAVDFLRFSTSMVGLYKLPEHLLADSGSVSPEADVRSFTELPFVNRKFKRAGMRQDDILCIDNLDADRAAYYKNNILHFFALPAILSYVLTNVHNGHIEELHRCFDHMFAKLQATYFLPGVESTHGFIDSFLRILAQRGLIVVSDSQWAINKQKSNSTLLRVMSRLGSELVQGDLPNLLDTIRRSSSRKDVRVASRLTSLETTTHVQAKASGLSTTEFYVQCEGTVLPGDHVEFEPNDFDTMLSGSVVRIDADGAAVRHGQLDPEEFDRWKSTGSANFLEGRATIKREQSGSGFITNLSPDGAFVTTSLRLKVGNLLTCSLGQQDNAFILHGRVARVTETGVGVYFEKLSEESKARIVLLSVDSSVFSK